ncbi:hypothetical protein MHYP_G00336600 [Metynnis hypsauchen]
MCGAISAPETAKTRFVMFVGEGICRHKSHKGKKVTKTIRSGSFLENSWPSLPCWRKFIYRFSQGLRLRQLGMMQDGIARSSRTLLAMASKIRNICKCAITRHARNVKLQIGGEREFVVIDESYFRHKRKVATGMATDPTRKSATAREKMKKKVGCLRAPHVHTAQITSALPRRHITAMITRRNMKVHRALLSMDKERDQPVQIVMMESKKLAVTRPLSEL